MIKCYTYRSRFMLCDLVKERKKLLRELFSFMLRYASPYALCLGKHSNDRAAPVIDVRVVSIVGVDESLLTNF